MAFNTADLLAKLEQDVQQIVFSVQQLNEYDDAGYNTPPAAGKWSIAQVIEHLNSYNRYYLPEIEKALLCGKRIQQNNTFRPGLFGNYFTKIMLPGTDGKIGNKMNAPKDHVPPTQLNSKKVIAEFLLNQNKLLGYLRAANSTDIGKLKVPISISRFIKLKLGDTFRFLIAHQQRHFVQIQNIVKALPSVQVKQTA